MMKIEVSDIEKFREEITTGVREKLSGIAHKGVAYAKKNGSYQNHTHNLRNAVGSAVVIDGEITDIYIPSNPGHEEAHKKTENLLKSTNLKNGIVLADGMEYASYVESKGFDVISGGAAHIEAEGKNLNEK